mmetsp:Transcript_10542/g.28189  ORF Transcript_10542/g.28189 Transcript_10542/m.28189 type:complete len:224 (+) Transcript_10542:712-1383(+)
MRFRKLGIMHVGVPQKIIKVDRSAASIPDCIRTFYIYLAAALVQYILEITLNLVRNPGSDVQRSGIIGQTGYCLEVGDIVFRLCDLLSTINGLDLIRILWGFLQEAQQHGIVLEPPNELLHFVLYAVRVVCGERVLHPHIVIQAHGCTLGLPADELGRLAWQHVLVLHGLFHLLLEHITDKRTLVRHQLEALHPIHRNLVVCPPRFVPRDLDALVSITVLEHS